MADEKAFDMTTKNRDTSRGPQNLQALRDAARRAIEALRAAGGDVVDGLIEGMPAPTAPQEYRDMRSPAEEAAFQEERRRAIMEENMADDVPMAPPDEPYEFPDPVMPDGSLVTPDQPPPSRKNKKSIDNPYGG
jgi:hypothetical protein